MHDLVIRGGTVVDGSGGPRRTADVAVTDGIVTEVGRVEGAARRDLDADGLLVTPGFVDIHTHFDAQATWDPHLTPSCWQGVTTALLGNCGVGFAPALPTHHDQLIELMEGVEDIPGSALSEGINWEWESFPEYLDALSSMPRALDIATQLPHAALRAYILPDDPHADVNAEQLQAMCDLLREALRAGALGFSTGRTSGHRDVHGNPVPGTFAPESELFALLDVMTRERAGVLQLAPSGSVGELGGDPTGAFDSEVDLLVKAGLGTTQAITFLCVQSGREPDQWKLWFDKIRAANAAGAKLRPQVGARCFGVLIGLQSKMNPLRHRASYRAIAHLPLAERVALLRNPELKARILAEPMDLDEPFTMDQLGDMIFPRVYPLGDSLDYEPAKADSVAARAAASGRDPWDVTYDLLLGSEGRDFLLFPLLNYGRGSYEGLHGMMSDPVSVQGLGDAGAHCGLVCDASMTTYLLSHWARDRTRGPLLPLETAVHRLSGNTAALYGLGDRGVLTPGRRADINVIDFEALGLVHPELVNDLPGGAGRLIQKSTGYVETLVAGETIVSGGELTDARPGKLVRGAR